MRKYISELLVLPGFISLEYGLYLQSPQLAYIIGGTLLIACGLLVAKNGTN